jgi:DNA polymerase-2
LKKAVTIAESQGFKLVHGIVDSMWLKKSNTTDDEYRQVCAQIEKKLDLPISFEGRYKWIVFLNSRTNAKIPVLNRYYGVLTDGTLKVRGIDLRRHDTPEIVKKCQRDMLSILSVADNSEEYKVLMPKALGLINRYLSLLRTGKVPIEDLVIEKRLSKTPSEYSNHVPQAIAARGLVKEGMDVHAGQNISYIISNNDSKILRNRALPVELVDDTPYDPAAYVELLLSSAVNLFLPFGYDLNSLRRITQLGHRKQDNPINP